MDWVEGRCEGLTLFALIARRTVAHWIVSYISAFGLWTALKQVEDVGEADFKQTG